ncbi:unnamed protein product [Caenorhabditis bovis]|uniref:CUB-like domain-containing protein n=1 Tax=Caenorhabditis bovis TaxID=2654633 RepID=A0A8S1EDR0_9PELO|nr:unnamed protein product [Caenorhabditis bovis]
MIYAKLTFYCILICLVLTSPTTTDFSELNLADLIDENSSECSNLNPLKMRAGETIYIPHNSTFPYSIPANFNCTYLFIVPIGEYLRMSVINSLVGKDYIEFRDSLKYTQKITTTAIANEELFSTTGTGHISIRTFNGGNSKTLLKLEWLKMPRSKSTLSLEKNANGKFVDCGVLQKYPITFKAVDVNETLAVSVAHSGYILDKFESFFIFDGPNTDSKVVGRMSDHTVVPFISSSRYVTIVGFSRLIVFSDILVNYESNIKKYRKYNSGVIIDQQGAIFDSINQTVAVTFIAKDGVELYITKLTFNEENENCTMTVISGTPSPISRDLVKYTTLSPLPKCFPQQFPAPLFTIELTDCSIYIVVSKNTPENFYNITTDRIGYAFTASYLEPSLSSQLDFTLSSNQSLTYSTTVESVEVVNDEKLTINVYSHSGKSQMSMVVTGNQTGGGADAVGTSVNIRFNGTHGTGSAKIRYAIGKSAPGRLRDSWTSAAATVVLLSLIV